MKQLLLFFIIIILSLQDLTAQTSQPPKEMIQQIAALKIFLDYARQGYKIVSGGLRTVNRIKSGDFRLHDLQFDHLEQVSPAVSHYATLSGIAGMQLSLIPRCNKLLQQIAKDKILTADERNFCRRMIMIMLNECKQSVVELIQLLTSYELALTDDERLNRLLKLQQKTIRLDASVRSFNDEVHLFTLRRSNEQRSIQYSRQLNNLQ